jgi:membrane protein DedA with SNARE-associated domain
VAFSAFLSHYGLLAIFIGAGVEGETVVVTGGLLARQEVFSPIGAVIAAASGSFIADPLFFAAGRRFRHHPRVQKLASRPTFSRAMALLERHPVGFVFAFRFLYGLRTVSPIAIGMSAVRTRTFLMINAAAAAVWGVIFTALGYAFGHGIEQMFGRLRSSEHVVVAAAGIMAIMLGVAGCARFVRRFRRPRASAE